MRRETQIIIVVIGVLFLIVVFWPKLTLPNFGDPNGASRAVEAKLGLDLVGGLRVIYSLQPVGDRQPDPGALSTTKSIIENRINTTGVAEPVVQTEGVDRVVVELPNAKNPDEIRALLVQTGKLDFVPLPPDKYGNSSAAGTNQAVDGLVRPGRAAVPVLVGWKRHEVELAGLDEQGPDLVRVLRVRELHDDAIHALGLDDGLRDAGRVDAVLDDRLRRRERARVRQSIADGLEAVYDPEATDKVQAELRLNRPRAAVGVAEVREGQLRPEVDDEEEDADDQDDDWGCSTHRRGC